MSEVSDYATTAKAEFRFGSPVEGKGRLGRFTFSVHQPGWASGSVVTLNGKTVKARVKKGYLDVRRRWRDGDVLSVQYPMDVRTVRKDWEYANTGSKYWNFPNFYRGKTTHHVSFQAGPIVFVTDVQDTFVDQTPVQLTEEDISGTRIVTGEDGVPRLVAGDVTLRPVHMMPSDEGEPYRLVWFRCQGSTRTF